MANYESSISIDSVIEELSLFVSLFMNGAPVVRAQVNRVSLPSNPCAVLTELSQSDIRRPSTDYQPLDDTATIHSGTKIDIQIDFYGTKAGEFCRAIKSGFRSAWGFDRFSESVKPLYTNDGLQSPLMTGEQQYESRWTLIVTMQYNPILTVPQQFADAVTIKSMVAVDNLTSIEVN
jgi:hypothetical protein